MEEEQKTTSQEGSSKTQEAWQQVGEQMKSLGESLAAAFRLAWKDEAYQQHKEAMQQGFESLVKEVSGAIHESLQSSEAKQAKQQAEKVIEGVRSAGEQTLDEVRPHLASALRHLSSELDNIIEKLEQEAPPSAQAEQATKQEES